MTERGGTRPGEVAAFERRLRQAGLRRQHEPGDRTLAALLEHIGGRRRQRFDDVERLVDGENLPPRARGGGPAAVTNRPDGSEVGSGAPGTVLSIELVGEHIRIFRIAPPSGFRYRPGQYVKVGAGAGKRRSFSLASAPYEAHLELCIALNPGGRLTPALFALQPGARLDVDPRPRGGFALVSGVRRHLMVATGTGIAPLRSMVRAALDRGSRDEFLILHGASHADGLPYRDELTALAASQDQVTYQPTVSRPDTSPGAWAGHTGRVDPLALDVARSLDRRDTHAYVCGHPGMVASLRTALSRAGFAVSHEAFD